MADATFLHDIYTGGGHELRGVANAGVRQWGINFGADDWVSSIVEGPNLALSYQTTDDGDDYELYLVHPDGTRTQLTGTVEGNRLFEAGCFDPDGNAIIVTAADTGADVRVHRFAPDGTGALLWESDSIFDLFSTSANRWLEPISGPRNCVCDGRWLIVAGRALDNTGGPATGGPGLIGIDLDGLPEPSSPAGAWLSAWRVDADPYEYTGNMVVVRTGESLVVAGAQLMEGRAAAAILTGEWSTPPALLRVFPVTSSVNPTAFSDVAAHDGVLVVANEDGFVLDEDDNDPDPPVQHVSAYDVSTGSLLWSYAGEPGATASAVATNGVHVGVTVFSGVPT